VLIGILPLQSHRHASFLHNEVPGITLSADALQRIERAGAAVVRKGENGPGTAVGAHEAAKVQGVYLMPVSDATKLHVKY